MKVEVTKAPAKCEPITLTITLETRDELLDMYVRNAIKNKCIVEHIENFSDASTVVQRAGRPAMAAAVNRSSSKVKSHALLSALKELL